MMLFNLRQKQKAPEGHTSESLGEEGGRTKEKDVQNWLRVCRLQKEFSLYTSRLLAVTNNPSTLPAL